MLPLLAAAAVISAGPAPSLTYQQLLNAPQGTVANWQSLKGKAVVLEFWATWCAPCVEQIPRWNALVEKFQDRPIQFIAVSYEDADAVASFLFNRPMSGWIALDPEAATFNAYGVDSIPHTVLVDTKGQVRAVTTLS